VTYLDSKGRALVTRLAATFPKGNKNRRALLEVAASGIRFQPFSKTDWYGLAGAERFEDGSEPWIGYFENLRTTPVEASDGHPDDDFRSGYIVADAQGISVTFLNDEGLSVEYGTRGRGSDDPVDALQVAQVVAKQVLRGKLPGGMYLINDER
jgi:hypothetical protein